MILKVYVVTVSLSTLSLIHLRQKLESCRPTQPTRFFLFFLLLFQACFPYSCLSDFRSLQRTLRLLSLPLSAFVKSSSTRASLIYYISCVNFLRAQIISLNNVNITFKSIQNLLLYLRSLIKVEYKTEYTKLDRIQKEKNHTFLSLRNIKYHNLTGSKSIFCKSRKFRDRYTARIGFDSRCREKTYLVFRQSLGTQN